MSCVQLDTIISRFPRAADDAEESGRLRSLRVGQPGDPALNLGFAGAFGIEVGARRFGRRAVDERLIVIEA